MTTTTEIDLTKSTDTTSNKNSSSSSSKGKFFRKNSTAQPSLKKVNNANGPLGTSGNNSILQPGTTIVQEPVILPTTIVEEQIIYDNTPQAVPEHREPVRVRLEKKIRNRKAAVMAGSTLVVIISVALLVLLGPFALILIIPLMPILSLWMSPAKTPSQPVNPENYYYYQQENMKNARDEQERPKKASRYEYYD
eukprot:TRINITY_DN670_c0_g1_i3.p2 TRINITY_DN670_c0_g1~~TRINITY_DN670_c0_g1_i3.p2  ORF type:complete len:194 (+),score=61.26 TRINITY_DN670_c0_g1_i3:95-676(+)